MATAGSGDVLAGVIAAFTARGIAPFEAAAAGVYIHGAAGDLAAESLSQYGLISSDIIAYLPIALKRYDYTS
jgi:NAD(P)H-hydrate epimerase